MEADIASPATKSVYEFTPYVRVAVDGMSLDTTDFELFCLDVLRELSPGLPGWKPSRRLLADRQR